jgi:hypothetical protein
MLDIIGDSRPEHPAENSSSDETGDGFFELVVGGKRS